MSLLKFLADLHSVIILTVLRRKGVRAGMTRRLQILALYRAVTFRREFVSYSAKYIFVFPWWKLRPCFIQTLMYYFGNTEGFEFLICFSLSIVRKQVFCVVVWCRIAVYIYFSSC